MCQWSPWRTAKVWIPVGSLPATSGSVIAKHERTKPLHSGRRYFSFCAGVAKCNSVCMLPSSGAWQLMMNAESGTRPHSADTVAMPSAPSSMPPNSFGMCGSHRPFSRASLRSRMISGPH